MTDDEGERPLGFGGDDDDRGGGQDAGGDDLAGAEQPGDGPGADAAGRDADRYAHRRDPDLAAYGTHPGRTPQPARLPAGQSRYTWFIGVVAVLVIAYVSVNTITTQGPGSQGVSTGGAAPPFAAPLATSNLSGDVNVARRARQGDAGKVTACSIHRPDVLTSCDLWDRKPLVLAFFATRGRTCAGELSTLQRISQRRSDVAFAAIAIRGSRSDVRKQIRANGWTFPVGYDHDGVLANLYSVAICPQVTYVAKGGRVAGTSFGEQDRAALVRDIDALAVGRRIADQP